MPYIISTYLVTDGRARGQPFVADVGRRIDLRVQALSDGWGAKIASFRSGAGPIMALEEALSVLERDEADVVVISGREPLRTGYSRSDRAKLMDIFGGESIPAAYTRLAQAFMARNGWTRADFLACARALESNYRRTRPEAPRRNDDQAFVTQLFRRVDCANPVIDFQGEVVVASDAVAALVGSKIEVLSAVCDAVPDGPPHIQRLSNYEHLARAIDAAVPLGFLPAFLRAEALLEVYTCFPVVPLAFILRAGWASTPAETMAFLAQNPVTVTGGMNLARAPWNNPALRALIVMTRRLEKEGGMGLVHGNGGLGGYQGVCVLRAML